MPSQPLSRRLSSSVIFIVLLLSFLIMMWQAYLSKTNANLFFLASAAHKVVAECTANSLGSVNVDWHAPNSTNINDLSTVVNGTGIHGYVFTTSVTPSDVSYHTYNWCNMPHVRPQEYVVPPEEYQLEYVEVIHRHHKRTPYASNTFPRESYPWYCDDEALFYYGTPKPDGTSAQLNWRVYTSDSNPFAPDGFNGTCQFPQITGQGLNDSRQHGRDLYDVYHGLLGFLPDTLDNSKIKYRVTNNVITSQVVGQLIEGMYHSLTDTPTTAAIQPNSVDSLEPRYSCSAADDIYSSYGVGSNATSWSLHLKQSVSLFAKLDSVSGVNSSDQAWHKWFDHYFDNLSARLCHQKPLPCNIADPKLCISREDADAVFRRGEYEYSFIYRDSPLSLFASTASFGVWMAELASNLQGVMNKSDSYIYRHNVAHDGSISRLLSILQVDVMYWPGMGTEVVFELYSRQDCWFIRVLLGGQVLKSSNPSLGLMNLIPVYNLLDYINTLVGASASKVPALCSGSN